MSTRKPRPTQTGRVTLSEIAERVGTSAITVSRVLNTPHLVSEELRTQIEGVIAELGYMPNRAARALARARSDSVAVLIPSLSNTVFTQLLEGVRDVLNRAGYRTLIGDTRYSPEEEESLLRAYLEHSPDGILITGFDQTAATRELLNRSRVPVVHMMEMTDGDAYSVGLEQFDAGRAITRHLLERGYRRIGFLGAQLDPRVLERLAGYRAALHDAGVNYPVGELLDSTPSSIGLGATLLDKLLRQAPQTDALFCCNDDLALGVLFECQRRGIRVPQQLAVAGFNDLAPAAWVHPALTTIATPRYEIGHTAAEMLLQLMKGEKPEPAKKDLGFSLVVREST
ncbi:LacI family DNA-binding transcriptional regulator [Noviherbaspirillum sp. CPCC 100848]|uniref:LacI family DNA-binding transcriptional regulator n=1 Tax=Noviherbaspirillum album TaxID=3080276 RepID=A0ABU6JHQ6_9BURK|nr:LacI family DNA-binding transcriptional regulator [Noviherbaspirillum sp. CPCC 100848]MEC4723021.1 LacI family DNA-binding transcriptional regulator [Noviherbaspirillum sp. CPCC 100848]